MASFAYFKGTFEGAFDPIVSFVNGYQDTESMRYARDQGLSNQTEVDQHRAYKLFLENVFENEVAVETSAIKDAVEFINADRKSPGYDVIGSFQISTLTDGEYGDNLKFYFTDPKTNSGLEVFSPQWLKWSFDKSVEHPGKLRIPPELLVGTDGNIDSAELKVAKVEALIRVKQVSVWSPPRVELRILSFTVDQKEAESERKMVAKAAEEAERGRRNFRLEQRCLSYAAAFKSCGLGASQDCINTQMGRAAASVARSICTRSGKPLYDSKGERWAK
jgi:hypothetical protein